MHYQDSSSAGPPASPEKRLKRSGLKNPRFLPGHQLPLSAFKSSAYLAAQNLVQQVIYSLSDTIYTYSPESFGLDTDIRAWHSTGETNAQGLTPQVLPMDIRIGAGSIIMGYILSKQGNSQGVDLPQQVIGSSALLRYMRPSLEQLSLIDDRSKPVVLHIAAAEYVNRAPPKLATDYVSQLAVADELDLGLVSSLSAHDAQHMALFATILSNFVPTIHTYDGIAMAREITRNAHVLDSGKLRTVYSNTLKQSMASNLGDDASQLLDIFNKELGTDYGSFEYHGHASASTVLIAFGSVEGSLASQVAQTLAETDYKVGVVNVRIYRPFDESRFLSSLPKSTKRLLVLGQVSDEGAVVDACVYSRLYSDVFRTVQITQPSFDPSDIVDMKYSMSKTWNLKEMSDIYKNDGILSKPEPKSNLMDADFSEDKLKRYTFWETDKSSQLGGPPNISHILSQDPSQHLSVRSKRDNLTEGGTLRTDIFSLRLPDQVYRSSSTVDGAFVLDEKLLKAFDVVKEIKDGGFLVLNLPSYKKEELDKRLSTNVRRIVAAKDLSLYMIDTKASKLNVDDGKMPSLLLEACFFHIVEGYISPATYGALADRNDDKELEGLVSEISKILVRHEVPSSWTNEDVETEASILPVDVEVNDFEAPEHIDPEPPTTLQNWVIAAKGLLFKEAHGTEEALRPDLNFKTSVVRVKERRRLTPLSYDRNIFHIEFDLGDSGLTYAIGEALGIHAHNDEAEVDDFIRWYGLDPAEIISIPMKDNQSVVEARTVHQALVQSVDIFGRPPKRFYETLAEYATDAKEKQDLLTLVTPDGATEFKRRAEVDTITFADILQEFPSAHPSFYDLVRIIGPIKRREYSIASSQRVTPTSVSLLIVTVNWIDTKKRSRFGQATRYLNSLVPGAAVTVSIKPSVMKLPQNSSAPIIMAGLGTGLAPFRAFVQEKALQKQQGEDIGSVLLYMGSRHQREEYLYGEEWEAYERSGVITLLGRAFSRDQPQKVYIQDRMRQTLDEIRQAYLREKGSFYLCGPTWPVPDVTEVLQEAIEQESRGCGKKVDARKEIEQLKEEQRYVLEVY